MFFSKSKRLLEEAQQQISLLQTQLGDAQLQISNKESEFNNILQNSKEIKNHLQQCIDSKNEMHNKYSSIIDKDIYLQQKQIEIIEIETRLRELNDKYQNSLKIHTDLEKEINLYKDTLEIGSFGLFKPRFSLETSEKYKDRLEANYEDQKRLIKNEGAVVCHTEWSVGGSVSEGRRMTNQYKKLMLFAFNGECDGLIAKVKLNNAEKTEERIRKTYSNINKLGVTQQVEITGSYLKLKLDELALSYEYEQKKYEEKEEQRRIREQMREEEKAQKELESAQKEAEDEERRFEKALEKAKLELSSTSQINIESLNEQIKSLEQKLQEAHERKERAIALAQLTKVGHIYIISNVGSFGEDVYKIGMTRRLDPLDRVRELGDASVPFHFDIHAVIYSENAPQLEYELHQKFGDRRLNKINNKKEFFKVTLEEIESFVKKQTNAEIQFTRLAEAREYRETLTLLEQLSKVIDQTKEETKFPKSLV